ncbi:hypothetical protein BJX64DRAFT_228577 [Aspergillus heterothallicus]
MASNRVERLQMRQRGAGTRKIKEVDFGFSLFGAPAGEASQTASQPTSSFEPAPAPEPPSQPPPLDAPVPTETAADEPTESQPIAPPTGDNAPPQEESSTQVSGNSPDDLPHQPSASDAATDERIEPGRSNKRRRIELPAEDSLPTNTQPNLDNGIARSRPAEEPTVHTRDEEISIPIRTSAPLSQDQAPQDQAPPEIEPITADTANMDILETPNVPSAADSNELPARAEPKPVRVNGTISPPSNTGKSKGRGRRRKPPSSPSQSEASNPKPTEKEVAQPTIPPEQATETAQEQDAAPEIQPTKPQKEKRGRGRHPAAAPVPEVPTHVDEPPAEDADSTSLKDDIPKKGVRGRKRKTPGVTGKIPGPTRDSEESGVVQPEKPTETQKEAAVPEPDRPSEDQPNGIDKGKKRAGRPKKLVNQSSEPAKEPSQNDKGKKQREEPERGQEPEEQPEKDTAKAPKRGKRREQPEPDAQEEEQPEPDAGAARTDKRRKRKERDSERERASEQEEQTPREIEPSRAAKRRKQREEKGQPRGRPRQPTPEQEEPEPEPEREIARKPEVDQEQTKGIKGRKGRRPENQTEEHQPTEAGATAEPVQATKRKPRQPRGETVPVTVHRIANPTSLGGQPIDNESASEDEAESPDEISSKQADKLPTRGGVNPADVLAQICRETLEKTLTTLKNGIDNEANAARRQEWTLRRKAVEAFGTELEGRLFELSEMLDSNFMLGVKVKKAKRNMMDLRARLDQVRREREAVALRTDAVRREHMKGEESRMARSTINHTLHNLDLALERGQNRTSGEGESLTAGLEFRLRTVAQSVSSTASGAHGGLLNQIKRFNAQLEATARKLEG